MSHTIMHKLYHCISHSITPTHNPHHHTFGNNVKSIILFIHKQASPMFSWFDTYCPFHFYKGQTKLSSKHPWQCAGVSPKIAQLRKSLAVTQVCSLFITSVLLKVLNVDSRSMGMMLVTEWYNYHSYNTAQLASGNNCCLYAVRCDLHELIQNRNFFTSEKIMYMYTSLALENGQISH